MSLPNKNDPAARAYYDLREYFGSPSKNVIAENSDDEEIPIQPYIYYNREVVTNDIHSDISEPFPGSESDYVPDSFIEETTSEDGTPRKKRHVKRLLATLEDDFSEKSSTVSHLEFSIAGLNTNEENEPVNLNVSRSEVATDIAIETVAESVLIDKTKNTDDHVNNVVKSSNQHGIRSWDKKHACLFCSQLITKLPRHLESKHQNEREVIEFLLLPKNSKERKSKIEKIRQLGNYKNNSKVLDSGEGMLIPKKRSKKDRNINDMVPCKSCFGLYAKKDIYVHYRRCAPKNDIEITRKCSTVFPISEELSNEFHNDIIANMRQDAIFHTIRQDSTVLKFGFNLYNKHKAHPHLRTYVSQRMRQLGRLLIEVRKINDQVQNLKQLIQPGNFDYFIQATRVVAGYKNDNTYDIPSLALRLRSSMQQCVDILKSDSIKALRLDRRKEIEDFSDLINMNFSSQISTHALNTVYTNKWNKTTVLPIAKDIKTLTEYCKTRATELVELMKKDITTDSWSALCDVTLVQTLIFNRRRAGEVERIFLATYLNRDNEPLSEEVLESLNEVEKHLVQTLTRFETRGKRGRKVPILLTQEIKSQIDFLCSTRGEAKVPKENLFLFANPKTCGFKKSSRNLNKFSTLCKVENPSAITSTKLRKHVATACQLLNLKDNEMDQLATYMGHDIRVHREFYRLPDSSVQISKVSKLLLTLEKGNLIKNKGKNFDDMSMDTNSDTDKDNISDIEQDQNENKKLAIASTNQEEEKDLDSFIQNEKDSTVSEYQYISRLETENKKKSKSENLQINAVPLRNLRRKCAMKNIYNRSDTVEEISKTSKKDQTKNKKISTAEKKNLQKGQLTMKTNTKTVKKQRRPKKCAKKNFFYESDTENLPEKRAAKPKIVKQEWSGAEKDAVQRHMALFWIRKKVPNKNECEECLKNEPVLKNRTWKHIKYYVYNIIQKNSKNYA